MASVSNFVQKTDYSTTINEIDQKITDHDHSSTYITTPEFKLTSENFTTKLNKLI